MKSLESSDELEIHLDKIWVLDVLCAFGCVLVGFLDCLVVELIDFSFGLMILRGGSLLKGL